MKKLLNSRGYISWSALQIFEQSPEKYKRKYLYGENIEIDNIYTRFGKKIADALENNTSTGDEVLDFQLTTIPKYKIMEKKLIAEFKSPYGVFNILAKMDTFEDEPELRFREYKSGLDWTQDKANKHGQILHYVSVIWLKYGKLPKEIWLDWIPTEVVERDGEQEVICSGEPIVSYKLNVTLLDVFEYLARLTKVMVKIDKMYREELGI